MTFIFYKNSQILHKHHKSICVLMINMIKDLPIMRQTIKETVNIYYEKRLHLSNHVLALYQMCNNVKLDSKQI